MSEPTKAFRTANDFERWLAANHAKATGIWVKLAKKATGKASMNRADALAVALCYGWIDAQAKGVDDRHWVQRYCPRRRRSLWSKVNRVTVAQLIEAKRMRPAGQRAIDAAKADGRWEAAYDSPKTAKVPPELLAALSPKAAAFFAALDSSNRYAILFRLQNSKKPETRERWIARFARMLHRGETLHPPRRKK